MRIKQSVCYPMIQTPGCIVEDLVPQVAEIGFSAIELWGYDEQLPEVVALAKRNNLAVATISGHNSLPVGLK